MALDLKIKSVLGFNGKLLHSIIRNYNFKSYSFNFTLGSVPGALSYTPCGKYIVYPLGCFVVLKNLVTDKECFLDGHSHEVSCISMSHHGDYLASGQVNFTGVKVCILIFFLSFIFT